MSDIEDSGTTVVDVEKPEKPVKQKKPRTEAQKKATAKALEALAEHRQKKWAEKEEAVAKTPKGKTTVPTPTSRPVPIPPPSTPAEPPAPKLTYEDDINALRAELQALKKAPKGKPKAPPRNRVKESKDMADYEDEESEEEEEVVVVRKPKKVVKRVVRKVYEEEEDEQKHPYMNNDVLQSIFFRNM